MPSQASTDGTIPPLSGLLITTMFYASDPPRPSRLESLLGDPAASSTTTTTAAASPSCSEGSDDISRVQMFWSELSALTTQLRNLLVGDATVLAQFGAHVDTMFGPGAVPVPVPVPVPLSPRVVAGRGGTRGDESADTSLPAGVQADLDAMAHTHTRMSRMLQLCLDMVSQYRAIHTEIRHGMELEPAVSGEVQTTATAAAAAAAAAAPGDPLGGEGDVEGQESGLGSARVETQRHAAGSRPDSPSPSPPPTTQAAPTAGATPLVQTAEHSVPGRETTTSRGATIDVEESTTLPPSPPRPPPNTLGVLETRLALTQARATICTALAAEFEEQAGLYTTQLGAEVQNFHWAVRRLQTPGSDDDNNPAPASEEEEDDDDGEIAAAAREAEEARRRRRRRVLRGVSVLSPRLKRHMFTLLMLELAMVVAVHRLADEYGGGDGVDEELG